MADPSRLSELYQQYGSLENAVKTKQNELELEKNNVRTIENQIAEKKKELESLTQKYNELAQKTESAEIWLTHLQGLYHIGYKPDTFEELSKLTSRLGGVDAVTKWFNAYPHLGLLETTITEREKHLKLLNSDIAQKETTINELNMSIPALTSLEKSYSNQIENKKKILAALMIKFDAVGRENLAFSNYNSTLRTHIKEYEEKLLQHNSDLKKLEDAVKEESLRKNNLSEDVAKLTEEKTTLEKFIDKFQVEHIDKYRVLFNAMEPILKLMFAQKREDLELFREWVNKWVDATNPNVFRSVSVEEAKRKIVSRIMGDFSGYMCDECQVVFMLDHTKLRVPKTCPSCGASFFYIKDLDLRIYLGKPDYVAKPTKP